MIGITTTVPVEIIYAAGRKVVDLNNMFLLCDHPDKLVSQAEAAGFSHNICAWIKGIYATVLNNGIKEIITVTGGDCSNTIVLGELLERKGIKTVPFEYPLSREYFALKCQMENLMAKLSTDWNAVYKTKARLDRIRAKLVELDKMTYKDNVVSGLENHVFLVSSSDFNGDPDIFEKELDDFLITAKKRKPINSSVRLGFLGVPPIISNFYEFIEARGARIVFNEIQRQFSMPYFNNDIVSQYLRYTYPYNMKGRINDIIEAVNERQLDGVIHYTQTFCYRQTYDIMLRESLSVPILTLEGDLPGRIDGRTGLRIETFLEMISGLD